MLRSPHIFMRNFVLSLAARTSTVLTILKSQGVADSRPVEQDTRSAREVDIPLSPPSIPISRVIVLV